MKSFFDQLAAQSDLQVVGQAPLESVEGFIATEGEEDIVEIDVSEGAVPTDLPTLAEVLPDPVEIGPIPEPSSHEVPPQLIELAIPENRGPVIEEVSSSFSENPVTVKDFPVEAQESTELPDEPPAISQEPDKTEQEAPAAAGLEEVFAWIAAGEKSQPNEPEPQPSDHPLPPPTTASAVKEVISEIVPQESESPPQPVFQEPTSPVFSIPAQRVAEPDPPPPIFQAEEMQGNEKPSVPNISIGAIQVTVDAGPAPEPIRPRVVETAPAPPPRSSSRTQLRRHYIIPH